MAQVRALNDAAGALNASVTTGATSITLQAGQGALFPQITGGDWFYVTVTTSGGVKEVMKCTSITADTLTVTRGVDGTSAQAFVAGNPVNLMFNAAILSDLQAQIAASIVAPLNQYIPLQLVMIWTGSIASIPAGWQLCDGTNGTPNLKDRFVIGSGNLYATGATGGATTATLSTANLPAHTHTITDPGHLHGYPQAPHNHGVNDPTHSHNLAANTSGNSGTGATVIANTSSGSVGTFYANNVTVGITVATQYANVSINNASTGISVNNTGSGTPFSLMPPYYAYAYIAKVASWS